MRTQRLVRPQAARKDLELAADLAPVGSREKEALQEEMRKVRVGWRLVVVGITVIRRWGT